MRRAWAALLFLFCAAVCLGCAPQQGGEVGEEDVWGVLEDMHIAHGERSDRMEVKFWWDRARLTTDAHFLVICDTRLKSVMDPITYEDRSIDKLYCDALAVSDGAFESAVGIAAVDYDYRQVFLCLSREAGSSDEAFGALLKLGTEKIRRRVPQAEILFLAIRETDVTLFEAAVGDANARGVLVESDKWGQDWSGAVRKLVEACKVQVEPAERENTEFIRTAREEPEWSNIGFSNANLKEIGKKRLLLIGDSISWGYRDTVAELLGGEFVVDHYQTSRGVNDIALVRELEFVAAQYRYDAVHFNIGLHRHGQTPAGYAQDLGRFADRLAEAEPEAVLCFSLTTPISKSSGGEFVLDEAQNADIRERNRLAQELFGTRGIPCLDLYSAAAEGIPRLDTVHYQASGYRALGTAVAGFVRAEAGREK